MPQVPRDKRAEFMRGHPPVFAHSVDPMDAEDWLRTIEQMFLMQTQAVQAIGQTLSAMQQVQQQPPPPQPQVQV